MTRSLVRPLTRSLTRSLVRRPSLDADAAAYIDALVSGGATVTSVQSDAIDTFIRAEKSGSRWDLIKRLYLPIWELAAPNAICMRSLTSGTFVNGWTHNMGEVVTTSNISYMDPGAAGKIKTLGMSEFDAHMMLFQTRIGVSNMNSGIRSGVSRFYIGRIGGGHDFAMPSSNDRASISSRTACMVGSSNSSTQRFIVGDNGDAHTNTDLRSATVPDDAPFMGASNEGGSPSAGSDGYGYGAWGYGLKMADTAMAIAHAQNVRAMWDTCTNNLALPTT